MTNTLHRFGKPDDLKDDYVVFTLTSKGHNEIGSVEKARTFLKIAEKYNPVNFAGDLRYGGAFRPEEHLTLLNLYVKGRRETVKLEQSIDEMDMPGRALVVFDNKPAVEGFIKELKEADLGLSVNISALVDEVREMTPRTGVAPHSVNYALGFRGNTYLLPDKHVLALTTMCGHGMISSTFAKKMIDLVKERRLKPEKAAEYMAKFCTCGAFNTTRAVRLLKAARSEKP